MLVNSQQIPAAFKDIRPYAPDELPQVIDTLLHDAQFQDVLKRIFPQIPLQQLEQQLRNSRTNNEVQRSFIYPVVDNVVKQCADGIALEGVNDALRHAPHTYITNHRDIVLDSALLSYLLLQNGFDTTVEIAIGDNLLIYPWIRHLVKVNKSFVVQRSLSMREMLQASTTMSQYMHFAINTKEENIWIAQREGRAKDSTDNTQISILKMMAMGGEGSVIERLKDLHIVPTTISYEYDPCDYLKAQEFLQKRDNPDFKKVPADDLINMKTGIFGKKGRIRFSMSECIDEWLDTLDASMPKTELFACIAQHIDQRIHSHYHLYPINYIALDLLEGTSAHAKHYTAEEKREVEEYFRSRIALVNIPHPDEAFLRERLLTMYANPARNYMKNHTFTALCQPIFEQAIRDYHVTDNVETPIKNPYTAGTIEADLYRKCWIDTVQWHFEDIIRDPEIDPAAALVLKRRIDKSNQDRTDLVETIDSYFYTKYRDIQPQPDATINTESPAWAIDRLSILALKIYHMREETLRKDASDVHRDTCHKKLDVLLEQQQDLSTAINQLLADIEAGRKWMKVYKQMKMYNDPDTNPVLYGQGARN